MESSKKMTNLISRALIVGAGSILSDNYMLGSSLLSVDNLKSAGVLAGSQFVSEYIGDIALPHLVSQKHSGLNSIEHYMLEPFITAGVYIFVNPIVNPSRVESVNYSVMKSAGLDVGAKYIVDALHFDPANALIQ
jgi:hypothetical protein